MRKSQVDIGGGKTLSVISIACENGGWLGGGLSSRMGKRGARCFEGAAVGEQVSLGEEMCEM
ncbi:hypothetical protein [Bartonella tribocorum]|uniref:hypothetical protein n=1 Tax=Bartonella tribocorum TaxID=85701 RepID=UPI001ABB50A8|nr:hypothetical protein [Bartonella tribocorum]